MPSSFVNATRKPIRLQSFSVIATQVDDAGEAVQLVTWTAQIVYDDNELRRLRGDLSQELTGMERAALLGILNRVLEIAKLKMF